MTTRWGIISAGKISSDFVTAMKVLPDGDHTILGVAARDKVRAEQFAKKFNIPLAFGSYEELLDNTDIEVVYIGVLHPQHFEVAKLSLERGKSVLCEKPLCMNLKETKLLVEVAKKNKLFLMEAFWSRCLPVYDYLRKLLLEKYIGDPVFLDVQFGAKIDVDRIWKKELGGGTVLDIGIYTLQMATLVFGGQPSSVVAAGHLHPAEGVDEASVTVLTYPSGGTAVCSTHCKVQLPNTAHIVGTKGSITVHAPFWAPTKISYSVGSGKLEEKEFPMPESKGSFNFVNSVGLSFEAAEVRRCLKEGLKESPLVSHEDSLALARLEDEIRKQLKVHYPQDEL